MQSRRFQLFKINALFSLYYAVPSLYYVVSDLVMCSFLGVTSLYQLVLLFGYTLRRFGFALFSFHNVVLSFGNELFLFGSGLFSFGYGFFKYALFICWFRIIMHSVSSVIHSSHYVLFSFCTLCMRSLYSPFFMRSFNVLFVFALCMHFLLAPFICTFYVVGFCANARWKGLDISQNLVNWGGVSYAKQVEMFF